MIPTTMKAAVRASDKSKILEVKDIPVPKLDPDEVLIRVEASPINPSDEYFAKGFYGMTEDIIVQPPIIPGFEGSGEVVAVGESAPKTLLHQKVAFCTDPHGKKKWTGAWAQYCAVSHTICVPIGDLDYDICSSFFVNPITSLAFLLEAKNQGSKGLVHTAAASSLGKMLLKVCIKKGVEIICVVRKPEQEKLLHDLGAKHVLNQESPDFVKKLSTLTKELGISICFDAVAGDLTGKILAGMPTKGTVYVYGSLSLKNISNVAPTDLLFYQKNLRGFWMKNSPIFSPTEMPNAMGFILEDMKTGGKIFKPEIVQRIKLEDCNKFVEEYKKTATKGKTIIKPNAK